MILSDCTKYKSSFGDGTWVVGKDISPGTYRSQGGKGCYWERLSGFGGHNIIANDFGSVRPVVTIAPKDKGFKTEDCGSWIQISKDSSGTQNDGSVQSKTGILPDSAEHSRTILIGTWTFTEPLSGTIVSTGEVSYWEKYVFMPDGTCRYFFAEPVSPNWGKGGSCQWTVKTSKYRDTGERYWYADIYSREIGKEELIILNSLHTTKPFLDVNIPFVKADVFPFSK